MKEEEELSPANLYNDEHIQSLKKLGAVDNATICRPKNEYISRSGEAVLKKDFQLERDGGVFISIDLNKWFELHYGLDASILLFRNTQTPFW